MAQGQGTLEAAWGEVEKAQSLDSAWAEVQAAKTKPAFPLTREPVSAAAPPKQFSTVDAAKETAGGAIEGFYRLPELFSRLQTGPARQVGKLFGVEIPQPPRAQDVSQAIVPLTPEQRQSGAYQTGTVIGGVAQLPILGPAGIPAMALAQGGQGGMQVYDEIKAGGGSELDAWKGALVQGGVDAASVALTAKLATKLNVNSGRILSKLWKNAALGVGTGQATQALHNALTRYTKQEDVEVLTGLKGRAATDAAVGLLMTAIFPGHKVSAQYRDAAEKVQLRATDQALKLETPPGVEQPKLVGTEGAKAVQAESLEAKTAELQAAQTKLAGLEEKNRGRRASTDDIQERLRLIGETQRLAVEFQNLAASGRQTLIAEGGEDVFRPNPNGPADLAPPETSLSKTSGSVKVPGQGEVFAGVSGSTHNPEILDPVVGFNSVDVVNDLAGQQGPTEMSLHNEPMLKGLPPVDSEAAVAAGSSPSDAPIGGEAGAAAVEPPAISDSRGLGLEARPALDTSSVEHRVAPTSETVKGAEGAETSSVPDIPPELEAEGKALFDKYGEPPRPPRPPVPDEALPGPGDPHAPDIIDRWLGDRQLSDIHARVKGARWKKALDSTLNQSKLERLAEKRLPVGQHKRSQIDEAIHAYIDTLGKLDEEYGKYGGELSDEHRAILARAAKLSPGQRALADQMILSNRELSQAAFDADVITNVLENYTKRVWQGEPSKEGPQPRGKARFQTFTTGALPRSYSSILEGWANGRELRIKGAIDASVFNEKVVSQVIHDRNLIRTLKKVGLAAAEKKGDDWQPIEHPNFKDYRILAKIKMPEDAAALAQEMGIVLGEDIPLDEAVKVYGWAKEGKESSVIGRDLKITANNGEITILHKTPLFAPKDIARDLNNILGESAIAKYAEEPSPGGKFVKAVDRVNSTIKTMVTVAIQDNQIMAAQRNILGTPIESIQDLNPASVYRRGWKQLEDLTPQVQRLIRDGGLQIAPSYDVAPYLEHEHGRFSKALDDLKIVGPAKTFAENNFRDMVNFLYGRFIPAFKTNLAVLEDNRLIRVNRKPLANGTMTYEAIAQAASRLSNNLQAGQNFQRMRINPTGAHMARLSIFAPDWTHSTLKTFSDAFRSGATGQAHRALWARMASRYVMIWAGLNLASAWVDDPESPVKNFKKRSLQNWGLGLREFMGWDITPILHAAGRNNPSRLYVNLIATAGEPFEAMNDPLDYLNRKVAVVPRMTHNLLTGENFFGRTYTTAAELLGVDDRGVYKRTHLPDHVAGMKKGGKLAGQTASYASDASPGPVSYEQMPSFLLSQGEASLPIQVQSAIDVMAGQMDGYEAMLRSVGFRVMAPSAKRQEKAGIKQGVPGLNLQGLFQ